MEMKKYRIEMIVRAYDPPGSLDVEEVRATFREEAEEYLRDAWGIRLIGCAISEVTDWTDPHNLHDIDDHPDFKVDTETG